MKKLFFLIITILFSISAFTQDCGGITCIANPNIIQENIIICYQEVPDSNTSVMYIDGILKKGWSFDIYEPDHEHCVVVSMGPFKEATPHFLNVLTIPNEAHESDVVAEVDLPKIKFGVRGRGGTRGLSLRGET